mgnify:CR=1 FL=1
MKDNDHDSDKDKDVERVKNFINKYRQSVQNTENIKTSVLLNLAALKSITAKHKTTQPNPNRSDQAFAAIKQHLGDAESSETLRQERWHGGVQRVTGSLWTLRNHRDEHQEEAILSAQQQGAGVG